MKKYYLLLIFLFSFLMGFAQQDSLSLEEQERREKNIQVGNPFKKFGYKPKISTLSQGKYLEFHDLDSVVQIGSFTYHVKKKVITGFIVNETRYSEATLRPEIISRWMSPDPLSEEFPSWSPYNFTYNNPIFFTDPTGLAPETIFENSITGETVEVDDGIDKTIVVNEEEFEEAKEYASLGELNSDNWTKEQFNSYSNFYDNQQYGNTFDERLANLGNYLADGLTTQILDNGLKDPYANIAVIEDYGLFSGGAGATRGYLKGIKWTNKMLKKYPGANILKKQIGEYWNFSVNVPGAKNGFTIYNKYINSNGKTLKWFHDSFDKTGRFIHREFNSDGGRLKIWYNGLREIIKK